MQLTQRQKDLIFRIHGSSQTATWFASLAAEFEAALDETERPADEERTDPFGRPPVAGRFVYVPSDDGPTVLAAAWLAMLEDAIEGNGGLVERELFDDVGVSLFTDTRDLYDVVDACGHPHALARRAFGRVRGDHVVPPRALRILGALGTLKVPKRRAKFQGRSRVRRLEPSLAFRSGADEIARAKAGTIVYALRVRNGTYEAERSRKIALPPAGKRVGIENDFVSVDSADVISDFASPFIPCPEAEGLAIDHFVAYLRQRGYTYQRLIHR